MGNTVLGVVAPLPQGAWNSTTTYQKLSVVREGNSSYIAKSANVNIQPGVTDSWETYWMLLNEDGDTGQQGPQGETGVGVPDGGLKGDILVKRSQNNYDDEWVDPDNITVGNATKAVQDGNGNNIADTYQTKQDSTTQNTALQTQITSNTQGITQNSQLISRNSARLTNLEQRISPSPFVTDSTVAYVKDVPANALPYAELQKLGGMTRKCTNLFPQGTVSGIEGVSNNLPSEAPVGTYTISGIASSDDTDATNCRILIIGADGSQIEAFYPKRDEMFSYTFTVNVAIKKLSFWASGNTENSAGDSFTFKNIMLNTGATALPYEPYFEGLRSAPVTSVESVGANLLPTPSNKEQAGVTVNVSADGIISFTGTSSDGFVYDFLNEILPVGTYHISWNDSNITDSAYLFTYDATNKVYLLSNDGTFTTDGTKRIRVFLNLKTVGTTVNGTVKPMLNKGATPLPYAPYTKSTLPIPESVRPANGINDTVYDFIEWDENGAVKSQKSVGVVDMGTLVWGTWAGDSSTFTVLLGATSTTTDSVICDKYNTLDNNNSSWNLIVNYDKVIYKPIGSGYILVRDTDYTDVASFKAAMAGVMLYYELATPEVTDISALITADNLIPVQGNGTITFVNEYGYAVPSTVEYMT